MKIRLIAYLLALVVPISICPVDSFGAPSRKPLPPVSISITPVSSDITPDQIKPGDIVEFKVSIRSSIPVDELRIDIKLVDGTKLVSGDLSWTGHVDKREEKALFVTIQAPKNGKGGINARGSLPPADGTRFSAEAHYSFGPEIKEENNKNEHPVKKDSKGRNVIEYR